MALLVVATALAGPPPRVVERAAEPASIAPDLYPLLAPGDLLFRRGRSALSRAVLALDRTAGGYSHVGIVDRVGGRWMVLHTLPREAGSDGGWARAEPIESFLASDRFAAAAVFRVRAAEPAATLAALESAREMVRARRPFDSAFDLESDDELYCTELVWKAFESAGLDLAEDRLERLDLPLRDGLYLLPGALARSPRLELVARFDRAAKENRS